MSRLVASGIACLVLAAGKAKGVESPSACSNPSLRGSRTSPPPITGGCGGGNYCPAYATKRGQMAPFLVQTFGLLLYGS